MRKVVEEKSGGHVREKISNTLKKKWQDPEFREKMLKSMKKRTISASTSLTQRQRISEAIKKKWQDEEYRQRAMKGMEESRGKRAPAKRKPAKKTTRSKKVEKKDTVVAVEPVKKVKRRVTRSKTQTNSITNKKTVVKKKTRKKKIKKKVPKPNVSVAEQISKKKIKVIPKPKKKEKKSDGDIDQMREERRDLYDLLYGDETSSRVDNGMSVINGSDEFLANDDEGERLLTKKPLSLAFLADDEDLDEFDPYGLED